MAGLLEGKGIKVIEAGLARNVATGLACSVKRTGGTSPIPKSSSFQDKPTLSASMFSGSPTNWRIDVIQQVQAIPKHQGREGNAPIRRSVSRPCGKSARRDWCNPPRNPLLRVDPAKAILRDFSGGNADPPARLSASCLVKVPLTMPSALMHGLGAPTSRNRSLMMKGWVLFAEAVAV